MTDWTVPLADVVVTAEDIEAVAETYRSGWLSLGPQTEMLEQEFARYAGARHAIAVANGTAALHLICLAAELGPGDEVVVPSLTFVATVNAIAYTGARPVFADVAGLHAPWLSAASADAAITPRTKAIMTVSYGGYPGETAALRELADRRGVTLLEDAAHSAGSRINGRHLGTFGAAGAFSFFSNKNLAVGEGGMVITDDDALAEQVRLMRSHGMTSLSWDRHRGHASDYDVVALGFNYRIDEPRAALARRRLQRLDIENRQRAQIDAFYRRGLEGVTEVEAALPLPAQAELSHHLFTIVVAEELDRDSMRDALAERGVQTSVHYLPVHRFAIYSDESCDVPVTEAYSARAITLPMFAHMERERQEHVVESLAGAVREARAALR
jgi:dTDP-4-amino-4,6-dideoxygalactose transaminase